MTRRSSLSLFNFSPLQIATLRNVTTAGHKIVRINFQSKRILEEFFQSHDLKIIQILDIPSNLGHTIKYLDIPSNIWTYHQIFGHTIKYLKVRLAGVFMQP